MGSRVKDFQNGFQGGANPLAGSGIAPLDCVASMTNMRLVRDQELGKRPGLRSVMGTLGGFSAGMQLYPSALNIGRVLGLDGTSARYTDYAGGASASATTLTALATTITPGYQAAQFRDGSIDVLYVPAYRASPSKGMLKWDGGTTIVEDVAGSAIRGLGVLWVYNQRLFGVLGTPYSIGAGYAAFPSQTVTLYWSGLNNGDTIGDAASGGGSANIRTYGGSVLVGGFAVGGTNYILHRNAISRFRGTTFDDINITAGTEGVMPNIGIPVAWKVIDTVGYLLTTEGVFLATEDGFRAIDSPQFPDPVRQLLLASTGYAPFALTYPWFVLDNPRRSEVWFIVTIGSTSRAFIWSTVLQRFTGQCTFGVTIASACSAFDSNGLPAMLFTDSTGIVRSTDFVDASLQVYQDASEYTSTVQCRRMYSQEDPSSDKSWRRAVIQMGSGAGITPLTVGATTGAIAKYVTGSGSVTSTTSLLAQQATTVQLSGQGSSVDLTITDNGTITVGWSVMRAEVEGFAYTRRNG